MSSVKGSRTLRGKDYGYVFNVEVGLIRSEPIANEALDNKNMGLIWN